MRGGVASLSLLLWPSLSNRRSRLPSAPLSAVRVVSASPGMFPLNFLNICVKNI